MIRNELQRGCICENRYLYHGGCAAGSNAGGGVRDLPGAQGAGEA